MKAFEVLREGYMARFAQGLAEARAEFTQLAAEVMLELPRPEEPELVYRIYRMDIIGQTTGGPKLIEINVDRVSPVVTSLEGFGIPIGLQPATWNGLEFVVDGGLPAESGLLPWIAKWLDVDDERYQEHADFQYVIHSCLRPTVTASGYWTSVDFGSAPVEAVGEFIQILARNARSIQIGSGFPTVHTEVRPS
jgi:hypothetical protein